MYNPLLNKLKFERFHTIVRVLNANTCRAKYYFKIETVTQLLEFHARSDHQTVPETAVGIKSKLTQGGCEAIPLLNGCIELVFMPTDLS